MNHPARSLSRDITLCNRSIARAIAASMVACAAVLSAAHTRMQMWRSTRRWLAEP